LANSTMSSRDDAGPASPRRVLIVEDDKTIRAAYERCLGSAGYLVETAEDGASGAAKAGQGAFDVILSDISMPGMDGLQLLRKVRERDLDVPVILMTGGPDVETAIRAVEYGALRYLVKPFELSTLTEVVGEAATLHQIAKLKRQALALVSAEAQQQGDLAGLAASFDRALSTLWIAFQPIVSVTERRVLAYEALLRSRESTLPYPGVVLSAAERLGRLPELGRAIRERIAPLVERAPSELVFINLHARDLLDESLFASTAPLTRHARRVVFEITERAALEEVPDALARVGRLRALGFRIAIDDLGAGYAGLTAFAQMEPEVVKFDMSLVRGLREGDTRWKLLRSMTALFKSLDLTVIAEGIETPEERDALLTTGCNFLQGYLFAKPAEPFPTVTW
jgi:EAL domain-containing protein (putative c-di-GMP-specific phosphodiesterase class I)/CheY-like chemotaxis protein